MAFEDAALERALRAETKRGLTLYCNGETLTALGYEWMAVVPMDGLRERLRGTLGALVEMLGYIPENDTVRIVRNKGGYLVQPELPETVGEEICGYAGETYTEEIRPTGKDSFSFQVDFSFPEKIDAGSFCGAFSLTSLLPGVTVDGKYVKLPPGKDSPHVYSNYKAKKLQLL